MSQAFTAKDVERLTGKGRQMSGKRIKYFFDVTPWLVVPVLLYAVIVLFTDRVGPDGTPGMRAALDQAALRISMLSDVVMVVTWGDLMVLCAVVFLFVEVIKSTSTASAAIVNHILSMFLFVVCLLALLVFASFATGTFFIITSIVLLDALAGMVVTIVSARRDFGVEGIGA